MQMQVGDRGSAAGCKFMEPLEVWLYSDKGAGRRLGPQSLDSHPRARS